MNMPSVSLGSVIAIVVLVAAIVLGLDHRVGQDVAVLIGALAVARLT
jgi:hypothetical protein